MEVLCKRVYEEPSKSDGIRILVDRLWPRGLTKVDAKVDVWLKDIAPSKELRMWFNHDPSKWLEFKKRYWQEIINNPNELSILNDHLKNSKATIVYGAKDIDHNNAVALIQFLDNKL